MWPFSEARQYPGDSQQKWPKSAPQDPLKVTSTDKQYLSISAMARGLHRNSGEVQRVASKNPWIKCLWTTLHSPDYTKVIYLAYKWSEVETKSVGLYRCYKTRSVFGHFPQVWSLTLFFLLAFCKQVKPSFTNYQPRRFSWSNQIWSIKIKE